MTNDRAVEILKAIIFMLGREYDTDEVEEAIHMAINALEAQDRQAIIAGSYLLEQLPSVQPEKRTEERTETHGVCLDTVDRQAVEHLDWFTKLYCRDKSITDDLAFKCEQCEFEMPDDRCLVKVMARKLCPDYKDFGTMGDL